MFLDYDTIYKRKIVNKANIFNKISTGLTKDEIDSLS